MYRTSPIQVSRRSISWRTSLVINRFGLDQRARLVPDLNIPHVEMSHARLYRGSVNRRQVREDVDVFNGPSVCAITLNPRLRVGCDEALLNEAPSRDTGEEDTRNSRSPRYLDLEIPDVHTVGDAVDMDRLCRPVAGSMMAVPESPDRCTGAGGLRLYPCHELVCPISRFPRDNLDVL